MSLYFPAITLDPRQRIQWQLSSFQWQLSSLQFRLNRYEWLRRRVSWCFNLGEIIILTRFPGASNDPNWLPTVVGEILRTSNEEPQKQPYTDCNGGKFQESRLYNLATHFYFWPQGLQHIPAYKAVNSAGKVGCECTFCFPSIYPFLFFLLPSLLQVVSSNPSTYS